MQSRHPVGEEAAVKNLHGRRRTFCTVPCDPRCSSIFCEGHKGTVILGLAPRIHKETGRVLVVGWIAGSKSGNDKKTNSPRVTKNKKHCHSESNEESSFINKADLFDRILRSAQDDNKKGFRMTEKKTAWG